VTRRITTRLGNSAKSTDGCKPMRSGPCVRNLRGGNKKCSRKSEES
jgi:hypothetical protein